MSQTLDRMNATLANISNADTAIQTAIAAILAQVKATTDDPAVLAVIDQIDAKVADIAQAALANTPAASQAGTGSVQSAVVSAAAPAAAPSA